MSSQPERKPRITPPPDDGREWILVTDAAALAGVTTSQLLSRAREQDWTRVVKWGYHTWLLKKHLMDWLDFLKLRENYRKRRRPQNVGADDRPLEKEDQPDLERIFWTTKRAAAYLGISTNSLLCLARKGRTPIFAVAKAGKGRRYFFSPTGIRNLKEDEDRLRHLAAWEKGKETRRKKQQGITAGKRVYDPRIYDVPRGWLTMRQAAERLGITRNALYELRRKGSIQAVPLDEDWTKKWRPYFIRETTLEEFRNSEHYIAAHQRGVAAFQAADCKPSLLPPKTE